MLWLDPSSAFWQRYEGPQSLSEIMRNGADLAGPEKIALHELLVASPHVIALDHAEDPELAETRDGPTAAAEQI